MTALRTTDKDKELLKEQYSPVYKGEKDYCFDEQLKIIEKLQKVVHRKCFCVKEVYSESEWSTHLCHRCSILSRLSDLCKSNIEEPKYEVINKCSHCGYCKNISEKTKRSCSESSRHNFERVALEVSNE